MEENIHESILFGLPKSSDNTIVINYCILYAKQYIYLGKLNDKNNEQNLNVGFWVTCPTWKIKKVQVRQI